MSTGTHTLSVEIKRKSTTSKFSAKNTTVIGPT